MRKKPMSLKAESDTTDSHENVEEKTDAVNEEKWMNKPF